MLRSLLAATVLASAFVSPVAAQSLNFAGLNGDSQEAVLEYYNGGTGSLGSGPGTNYGISFSSNALACSVQPNGRCNTGGLPTGGNALFFLSGAAATMNVSGGFTSGFSFFYSAINDPAFVRVFDGLNGTGNLLATLSLATTPSQPGSDACAGGAFCPYVAAGIEFAGTARSVDFGGAADQVAFAAITINSATPGAVPEPAGWAVMLLGFGAMGGAMRRRQAVTTKVRFA